MPLCVCVGGDPGLHHGTQLVSSSQENQTGSTYPPACVLSPFLFPDMLSGPHPCLPGCSLWGWGHIGTHGLVCPSCPGDGARQIRPQGPGPRVPRCIWSCEREGMAPFFPQHPAHTPAIPAPCAPYFSLSKTSRGFLCVQSTLYYRPGLPSLLPPDQDLLVGCQ